ncbi:MAG: tetratricopeptide repeat protein [Firmicutes bacterium]|nr:tetratricopeptide repeat protein [Bacillota bacterium]
MARRTTDQEDNFLDNPSDDFLDRFSNNSLEKFLQKLPRIGDKTKRVLIIAASAILAILVIALATYFLPKGSTNSHTSHKAKRNLTSESEIVAAYNKGKYKDIVPGLEKLVEADGNNLKLREMLASVYLLTGDNKKAYDQYQAILKIKPDDAETLYKTGVLLEHTNREKEGITYLIRATQAAPNVVLFHIELARAYTKAKLYADAVNEWKNVLKLLPPADKTRANVLAEMAGIYIGQNDFAQAKEIIATGLAIDPDNQTLRMLETKIGGQIQTPQRRS